MRHLLLDVIVVARTNLQSTSETIDSLVLEKLGLPASAGPVDPEKSLFDLGLTSLQIVDLVFMIEDRLQLAIPDEAINSQNFHSARSILALIDRLRSGRPSDSRQFDSLC